MPCKAFMEAMVRIYHTNGKVVGAGCLVAEGYVLTCAHVVTEALGLPSETVEAPSGTIEFDFPLRETDKGQKYKAKVVFWSPVNPNKTGEDIAGLEAEGLPKELQATCLVSASEVWGHNFQVFGYPKQREMIGVWATGRLLGINSSGWVQIEDTKAQGYSVDHGFSGSPVWDDQLQEMVGIVVAAEKKCGEAKTAFMIPTDMLVKAWTKLTLFNLSQQSLDRKNKVLQDKQSGSPTSQTVIHKPKPRTNMQQEMLRLKIETLKKEAEIIRGQWESSISNVQRSQLWSGLEQKLVQIAEEERKLE